jgi:CRP/FNR family transcriptional regulator
MEIYSSYTSCCIGFHKCNCFNVLTEEERELLLDHSALIRYHKGENIFKQGERVSTVQVVESGLVKVYLGESPNSLVLKIVTEGNLVGLTSLSETISTFQYSAKAYKETVIRQIDLTVFRNLVLSNPLFAKSIIDILNSNNIQISNRFFCLTYKQAYGRLADILLCLSDRVFNSDEFELPLNRKELAELTGLAQETVIRMLKQLVSDNLITISGKNVTIRNRQLLKEISDKG